MTIALRSGLTGWSPGTTSVAPDPSASLQVGDMMILYVGCKSFAATIQTPAGWTLLTAGGGANGGVASGIDVGSVLWATFYKEATQTDVNNAILGAGPTVTVTSGGVALGVIIAFSKTASVWETPVAAKGQDTSSDTDFSLTMDADPGITVDDMLAYFATIAGNNATFDTPTITATSATIGTVTEAPVNEGTTALGDDLESSASHALCTAGTATAAPVCGWTLSVAQTGGGSIVRLREVVETLSTFVYSPFNPGPM